MSKSQPVVTKVEKTPSGSKERTTDVRVLSIQRESGKNTRKKRHLQINKKKKKKKKRKKKKERNTCGYRNDCISKDDWTKGRGFNESIETKKEAKQNKRNTREKTPWHLQTERPEDTSSRHLWLVNKGKRTGTSPLALGYPLLGSSRHVRAYHCMP